ncbi:hypothetical protein MRX96_025827 [Rhipicephalus microplus]
MNPTDSEEDESDDTYDEDEADETDDDHDGDLSADLEILVVDQENNPEDFKVHASEDYSAISRIRSGSRHMVDDAEGYRLEEK